jgi:hypothetical protein
VHSAKRLVRETHLRPGRRETMAGPVLARSATISDERTRRKKRQANGLPCGFAAVVVAIPSSAPGGSPEAHGRDWVAFSGQLRVPNAGQRTQPWSGGLLDFSCSNQESNQKRCPEAKSAQLLLRCECSAFGRQKPHDQKLNFPAAIQLRRNLASFAGVEFISVAYLGDMSASVRARRAPTLDPLPS